MRRFRGYRPNPPEEYYKQGAANKPNEVQYEGVVFSDGTVCIRWMTEYASHSIWKDYETFYAIHGHPEYGTVIEWLDDEKLFRQPLTKKQEKIYTLLKEKPLINFETMAMELGLRTSTIHEHLQLIQRKGWAKNYKGEVPAWVALIPSS